MFLATCEWRVLVHMVDGMSAMREEDTEILLQTRPPLGFKHSKIFEEFFLRT
jgi:hypothetical protein